MTELRIYLTRRRNIHGGGSQTNTNGLAFELDTDLKTALENTGSYNVKLEKMFNRRGLKHQKNIVQNKVNDEIIGYILKQEAEYIFMEESNVDWRAIMSKQYRPDELFINLKNKTIYVVEKKFQAGSGSVDEKLQTFVFKRERHEALFREWESEQGLNVGTFNVKFCFLGNSTWFDSYQYELVKESGTRNRKFIEIVTGHEFF